MFEMSMLTNFINFLGYGTTIVYLTMIYKFFDFMNVPEELFTFFWAYVCIIALMTILSSISNKLEEREW